MQDSIVIVGAGQAGAQVAQSLRQGGYAGSIRLIGEEVHPPYQRPPLSKKFLAGDTDAEGLWLRPSAFYETQSVELLTGAPVARIDPAGHQVMLATGELIPYGKLVLATGTRARRIPLPGVDLGGVLTLRSIADVDRIRDGLAAHDSLAVIGAGYIGLEVAAVARAMGKAVTVIEAQDRVLKRVVSPVISAFYEGLHSAKGVDLRLGTGLAAIEGEGHVSGVRLADGSVVPAGLVLMAVGAEPNDDLAVAAGLETDNGILVDGGGQTSDPDIYAAGDCTRFFLPRYDRSVRLESVQNAIDQAKVVAQSILGQEVDYDPLPWFWSDQYHVKLQIAGLSEGYDEVITVGEPADEKFYVAYLRQGRLIAVDSINSPRSHMMARKAIGEPWRADLLPAAA